MDFTTTEGLERFNKIVSYMGLFVPPDEQTMIEQNELGADEDGTYPAVHAYVNEDCWKNNRGHLIALIDEAVYMCVETQYDGENLFCNGAVPAWSLTDSLLIEHLGSLIKDYKADLVRKKKLAMLADFADEEIPTVVKEDN